MGLTLREALKSLCSNSDWNYAVFWKLKPLDRMILTWEDGYYESTKAPGISNLSTLTAPDSLLKGWNTGGNQLDYEARGSDGRSMEDQMRFFMTQMSNQTYSVGEGIIGHAASSGKHRWVFQENCLQKGFSFGSQNGCSDLEYPAEWKNQFAAGIKTVAVIAAAPYGVVQLGSKQTIIENLELVSHIKALFQNLQNVVGAFSRHSIPELLGGRIHGTQPRIGMRSGSGTLLHGITQSIPKIQCSNIIQQEGGSIPVLGMTKCLQAEVHVSPSICSSSGSNKAFSHFSQLQQNRIQLSSPTMSSEQEALSGDMRALPSARVMLPSQDSQQANLCGTDRHQPFLIQSSRGSNGLSLMEQQLVKEMGLQGQLPLLLSNGKSTVHTSFRDIIPSGFRQTAVLNSTFRTVESNNCGRNLPSSLSESIRGEGILRAEMFQPGTPHLSALKQTERQPSGPGLQHFVQTKNPSAFSRPPVQSNLVVGIDQNKKPLAEVNTNHLLYKAPTFSSANMEAPVSDSRQCPASGVSWSNTSGQFETFLETVRNDLVPSEGVDFSMSAAHGIEPQPWDKETLAKDMSSSLFQDTTVENPLSLRESSKVSEAVFGELLPVTDEYGYNGLEDFDKYLKSLMKGQDNSNSSISLPAVDEIFDALGPVSRNGQDHVIWDDMFMPLGDGSSADFSSYSFGVSAGTANPSDPSIDRSLQGGIFSERKSEHLLDAVVANIRAPLNQSTDDNMSTELTVSKLSSAPSLYSASVKADSCSTGPLIGCEQKQSEFVGHSQTGDDADIKKMQNSLTDEYQRERAVKRSLHDCSLKFQPSSWAEDCHSAKCENMGLAHTKKSDEPVKVNRKRAKPGESTRPRPKDRQQIQDRVRELREIVPNGTKCSIDALLDRTIKHMLFLQSVTKHAEKLKHSGEPKVLDKDGSFLSKGNLESGASWAVELGGQTMGCPIIVENMNQPRQLLIEMLCDERGLFLEIADSIRSLRLTILKGVMEARTGKIWARFVVEADTDVQRLDILWQLMQILQQNTKNGVSLTHQPSVVTHQGMWFPSVQCVSATSDASHL